MYRLKNNIENFKMVDGPQAGQDYVRGGVYADIPAGYADRFESVLDESQAADAAAAPARETPKSAGKKEVK